MDTATYEVVNLTPSDGERCYSLTTLLHPAVVTSPAFTTSLTTF